MTRFIFLLALLLGLVTFTHAAEIALPHWIAIAPQGNSPAQLIRRFTLDAPATSATLKLASDFCRTTVHVNGHPRLIVEPYCDTQQIDITDLLRRGENQLTFELSRPCGPAAIVATVLVERSQGEPLVIHSDASWLDREQRPCVDRGPVRPELWGVGRRSIAVSPFENYQQWQQSKDGAAAVEAGKLTVPPGFQATLVRQAAADEGSWIALAFDDQGRATISREDQGLLRLTLDDSRQRVTKTEPIDVELKECRGLLYRNGSLYANANRNQGLFRLRIDDAGRVHDLTELRHFAGKEGHGRNDIAEGFDGKLYTIHGDSVDLPRDEIKDHTSPLRESYRTPGQKEGHLLRSAWDGKSYELLAAGLRNPYGVAIHKNSAIFTYDADNEYDMGLPWYRPTRILQLLPGADYGYREATGRIPGRFHDQPEFTPPTLDIGRGSPTAAMFGYWFRFPRVYRETLYVLDWSYGRVLAVHLVPRGLGYRAAAELFAQGRPLNVTDIAAGPDGAMYLITGGRKTQSALYRIAYTGDSNSPDRKFEESVRVQESKLDPSRENFGIVSASPVSVAHESRCSEISHRLGTSPKYFATSPVLGAPEIADPDPMRRSLARTALERQPIEKWRSLVLEKPAGSQQLAGLLSLVQTFDRDIVAQVLDKLRQYDLTQLELADRFVWLRVMQLGREAHPARFDELASEFKQRLLDALPHATLQPRIITTVGTSDEWRRRLTFALGELQEPRVIPWVVDTLFASAVQEDRLAGLVALRSFKSGWTLDQRRAYFHTLNESATMLGGQGLPVLREKLRTDAVASLSDAERTALGALIEEPKSADEPLPPPRKIVQRWTLADLAPLYEHATGGDATRGQIVYRDALCIRCHRAGLRGASVGPELTTVARRFSRRDMLESIVAPSLAVAENYRNVIVETDAGQIHTGRVVFAGDFRSEVLQLATDPLRPSQTVELDKKQIVATRVSHTSPMPQGLLDGFTLDEIRDLLAFLEAAQ